MEDKSFLLSYGDDDVVSFLDWSYTYKVSKFRSVIKNVLPQTHLFASVNSELNNKQEQNLTGFTNP